MAISLLQLKMKLHPQSAYWKNNGEKSSVFLVWWPARFGLGRVSTKTLRKNDVWKFLCLPQYFGGWCWIFAGHGNRETLCYASHCWQCVLKRIGKGDAQQTSQVSDAIIPTLPFLITQEDRKLIWPRNQVVVQRNQISCILTLWHKTE